MYMGTRNNTFVSTIVNRDPLLSQESSELRNKRPTPSSNNERSLSALTPNTMEKSGTEDEFFGDQSSDSDANSVTKKSTNSFHVEAPSNPFGNVADHEYRSHAASVKTLSYLDGYDETKEERLQDGFSDGYRQSFSDAFRIGSRLGSVCAKTALLESSTVGIRDKKLVVVGSGNNSTNSVNFAAPLIRKFLTNEILMGSSNEEGEKSYVQALLKLEDELEEITKF